jgi:uncharacterized protein (TIGR00288 family)
LAEQNVAVLIDYENVGLDAIQYLLDQLSDVGRVIIKRAYGDWSVQKGPQDQLIEFGIEPVHQYHSNRSGKNSSDIRLAIDAVELLYAAPIDTFVVVSSDSDFVPLAGKLRSSGKNVIGSGRREATSITLIKSCDRYIFLDDAKPAANATATNRGNRRRRGRSPGKADAMSVLTRAMEASMDDVGNVVGSKLYQTMLRIDPGFDYKALGHRNFKQFLENCHEVKVVPPQHGGDVVVQFKQTKEEGKVSPNEPAQPRSSAPSNSPTQHRDLAPTNDATPPEVSAPSNGALLPDETAQPSVWDADIDTAWNSRQRRKISGRASAADAAKILGVTKLSASRYPSLDKLLAASKLLQGSWHREGNTIVKN